MKAANSLTWKDRINIMFVFVRHLYLCKIQHVTSCLQSGDWRELGNQVFFKMAALDFLQKLPKQRTTHVR